MVPTDDAVDLRDAEQEGKRAAVKAVATRIRQILEGPDHTWFIGGMPEEEKTERKKLPRSSGSDTVSDAVYLPMQAVGYYSKGRASAPDILRFCYSDIWTST